MADTQKFHISFWPTLFSVFAISLAIGLGIWQVQRLTWKEALIEEREGRIDAPATPLSQHISRPEELTFRSVTVDGTWIQDVPELLMLANDRISKKTGYYVLTPFRRDNDTVVLINRGWVPGEQKLRADRPDDILPKDRVTVEGVARHIYDRNKFTPENDPEANVWFWTDYAAMSQETGLNLEPIILELKDDGGDVKLPIPGQTRFFIPNDHLQYAITWFSMAIAGMVIWYVWHLNYNRALRSKDEEAS